MVSKQTELRKSGSVNKKVQANNAYTGKQGTDKTKNSSVKAVSGPKRSGSGFVSGKNVGNQVGDDIITRMTKGGVTGMKGPFVVKKNAKTNDAKRK